MSLREEAAASVSEICTTENRDRVKEFLEQICPPHLVRELTSPPMHENQFRQIVSAVDRHVKTEESEWGRRDHQEVLKFLKRSRQSFSWEVSRLKYLDLQESRRVGEYLIDNLNMLLKEGKEQSQLIRDASAFFRLCSVTSSGCLCFVDKNVDRRRSSTGRTTARRSLTGRTAASGSNKSWRRWVGLQEVDLFLAPFGTRRCAYPGLLSPVSP
eukprot:744665-Hanusia_phi.AAC.1